jgi:hypothetical protein
MLYPNFSIGYEMSHHFGIGIFQLLDDYLFGADDLFTDIG